MSYRFLRNQTEKLEQAFAIKKSTVTSNSRYLYKSHEQTTKISSTVKTFKTFLNINQGEKSTKLPFRFLDNQTQNQDMQL